MAMLAGRMCRTMWGLPSSTSPSKGRWAEETSWKSRTSSWPAGLRWTEYHHTFPTCVFVCFMVVCVLYISQNMLSFFVYCEVIGAGVGDWGAVAQSSVPQHDRGPGSPLHGSQHSLQWGGVSRRVPPAPQQGVHVRKQACQRSPT